MTGTFFAPMNHSFSTGSKSAESAADFNTGTPYSSKLTPPIWSTFWDGVIIVDPQPLLAQAVTERMRSTLAPMACTSATSIEAVIALLRQHPKSLIVSPPRLADGPILQLAILARTEFPHARLAIWADYTPQLITTGSYAAIIPRSSSITDFEETIKTILTSQALKSSSANTPCDPAYTYTEMGHSQVATLTERQLDLLILIAEGLSIKQIAQRWGITNKSVDSLKYRLMKELHVHNRVALTRLAILEGLIDPLQISTDATDDFN